MNSKVGKKAAENQNSRLERIPLGGATRKHNRGTGLPREEGRRGKGVWEGGKRDGRGNAGKGGWGRKGGKWVGGGKGGRWDGRGGEGKYGMQRRDGMGAIRATAKKDGCGLKGMGRRGKRQEGMFMAYEWK